MIENSPEQPNTEPHRVLIVHSEQDSYRELVDRFQLEDFTVAEAADGRELLASARTGAFDMIVIDMVMAGIDGLSVLRTLRSAGNWTPVLVYATQHSEIDCMLAFELGADDFVSAPRSDREIVSRIRAILRRTGGAGQAQNTPAGHAGSRTLKYGSLEIDEDARDARVNGEPLQLRPREFALLLALAKQPGVALSRKTLVDRVWGFDYFGDERTVDNHVRQIRAKLEAYPSSPSPLRTIYGFGYRFEPVQAQPRNSIPTPIDHEN
jgi:DNA-binding response OmpR family regulator